MKFIIFEAKKQPQNAKNRTYEAISGSEGSKLVVQGWYKAGNITEKWSPNFEAEFFYKNRPRTEFFL